MSEINLKELNSKWEALTKSDFDNCKRAAEEADYNLAHCAETNHGRYLHMLEIPKLYTKKDLARFEEIVAISDRIMSKITNHYLKDPEFRKLFPFSKELEELILTPRGYSQVIPMARYDIFYNEETGDFKFCEINTDGTSAMNEDVVTYGELINKPVYRLFAKEYDLKPFELFDSWVAAFEETYRSYDRRKENPHIAIVDFLEEGCLEEFRVFKAHFRQAGYNVEICEIRDLTYTDGKLYSPTGQVIDAIYRRAVTGDVERHLEETSAFRAAVKDQAVCLIGAFCTQIPHHKLIFKIMHEKACLEILTPMEQAFVKKHVPKTYTLTEEVIKEHDILKDKDSWIIKPFDSYGSRGVLAGVDATSEEWVKALGECAGSDYIVQEYCTPYRTRNCYLPGENSFREYNNMPGLYAYNGRFAGVYSRLSDGGIISSQTNKRVAPTLAVTLK